MGSPNISLAIALGVIVACLAGRSSAESAPARALRQAETLHRQAKFDEAAAAFRALWEADASLLEAHLGYQEAMVRAARGDELIALYEERATASDAAVDHYLHGRVAETRDAVKALKSALSANEEMSLARACLAHVLVDKGSLKQAAREADRAVTECEARLEAAGEGAASGVARALALCLLTRAWVGEATGKTVEALADTRRAVELQPELARGQLSLAFLLELEGKTEEAVAAAQRAVELDPVSVSATCTLARLEHEAALEARAAEARDREEGEEEEAGEDEGDGGEEPSATVAGLAVLDRAIALMPAEAELHYTRGMILSETRGARSAALSSLQRAIELDSEDVYYQTALAETYSRLNRHSRAREVATEAIKIDRKSPEAYRALALACMALDDWKTAIDALGRAMKLDPTSGDFPFWQAECYEKLRDTRKAMAAYERAAKVAPEDPEPHLRLGIISETQRGNDKDALASYRRYLELGGKDERVKEWISDLER